MTDPVDLTISRLSGPVTGDIVRIEAKDGPRVLATIELPLHEFAVLLMGGPATTAAFSKDGR